MAVGLLSRQHLGPDDIRGCPAKSTLLMIETRVQALGEDAAQAGGDTQFASTSIVEAITSSRSSCSWKKHKTSSRRCLQGPRGVLGGEHAVAGGMVGRSVR